MCSSRAFFCCLLTMDGFIPIHFSLSCYQELPFPSQIRSWGKFLLLLLTVYLLCLSAGTLDHPSGAVIAPEIETFTACRDCNYFQLIHCNSEAVLAHASQLAWVHTVNPTLWNSRFTVLGLRSQSLLGSDSAYKFWAWGPWASHVRTLSSSVNWDSAALGSANKENYTHGKRKVSPCR